MNKLLLLTVCLLLTIASFAQNKDYEQKKKLLAKASELYKAYKYTKALAIYQELDEMGSITAPRRIGDCYREMNDLVNAEIYYARAVQDKNIHERYFFYYAQALMSNEKYEEAKKWFLAFKEKDPQSTKADGMIAACDLALSKMEESSPFKLYNLDINTTEAEFSPYFYDNGIIFTSSRIESALRKKDAWTNTGYLDVYYAPINWRDTIPSVSKLKGSINTFNFHDGPACVNKEGTKIYFTRNNVIEGTATESKSGDIKLKIFSAEKSGDGFKNIKELNFNSDEYSSAYPSINHNETVIYFSSDRAGGYGGADIYSSTYNESKQRWERPVNAGPAINTEQDERFPFIHDNGTLFFSSNGHIGLGGLDIYAAEPDSLDPNTFNSIRNLGSPFNSSRDDFSYILDKNERTGYFASNREGGKGNDDIYMFTSATIPLDVSTLCNDTANNYVWITVYDINNNIVLERNHTDLNGNFYSRLEPNQNYMIIAKKNGFITEKFPLTTSSEEKPIQLVFKMIKEETVENELELDIPQN